MSNIANFPNERLVYDQAAEWLFRLEEGGLAQNELNEFKQWIGQSNRHHEMFVNTLCMWDRMSLLEQLSEIFPLEGFPKARKKVRGKKLNWIPGTSAVIGALFATLAVTTIIVGGLFVFAPTISEVVIFQTDVGLTQDVALQDGSELILNTDTKVEATINTSSRQIELLQGEAFFDVAHNTNVPFVVKVEDIKIEAIGTAFGVRKLNGVMDVIVTDGKVLVTTMYDRNEKTKRQGTSAYVHAGNKLRIDEKTIGQVTKAESNDVTKLLMWQKQMLSFNGETLDEVVKEFGRYTNVNISIMGEATANVKVGGYFRSNDLDGLLLSLEKNFGITAISTIDATVVLSLKHQ